MTHNEIITNIYNKIASIALKDITLYKLRQKNKINAIKYNRLK